MKQRKLDRIKTKLNFGADENSLPVMNWKTIDEKIAKGEQLVVIDGLIHDVKNFIRDHPGGEKILKSRIGKDATVAFNGGAYRHSKAARNIAAVFRIAKLP